MTLNPPAESARLQYAAFAQNRPQTPGHILRFTGVDGYDIYNPSIPFTLGGQTILAARVERRNTEVSRTMFFRPVGDDTWALIDGAPIFDLQDPFITYIGGELWLGGVYVRWDGERLIDYATRFYRGSSLDGLALALEGPKMMKDIRLLELADGRIAVFSRPQGECMKAYGCIAKIGFTIVDSVDSLSAEVINGAPLLEGQFLPDEWGGCNQLYRLANDWIGVIGHKSWGEMVDDIHMLHYYSMAFAINPNTRDVTQTKVIAARDCFPDGPTKIPRTADVTFTAGLERLGNGKAMLYAGLSDCQVGRLEIDDPLEDYESLEMA